MKNMKGRQKLSDNQSSESIQAAMPEMSQNIRPINMTDNHNLFFSPGDGTKDFGAVLHEVQEYISSKYSTLIIDGGTEEGKSAGQTVHRQICSGLPHRREGMTQSSLSTPSIPRWLNFHS